MNINLFNCWTVSLVPHHFRYPLDQYVSIHYILLVYLRGIGDKHAQLPNSGYILQLKPFMSLPQAKK